VANIKSQIKRNRQNERRRVRNKSIRTALKTSVKKVRTAAESGQESAAGLLRTTTREFDRAVSKGTMHKRAAARRKSRLARSVASASSASSAS
jgi:small subunit ribosomal protein S20